jgi:LysR family transcriptional activator of nhaA
LSSLNYHHLRYFWAVAHDGNLTRTAERLNLSQSALSVQIRKLEARLGHDLFERRGRELRLTEAGRIALDHADAIFAAGDELVGTLRHADRDRRTLRVGALATLSRNFMLEVLRPALGRGDVEVSVRSGGPAELMAALAALNLDLVLTNRPPPGEGGAPFLSHRLAERPVSLVGAPGRYAPGQDLADLLVNHPVILPTPASGVRTAFDALADRLGVKPLVAAEADDMAMLRLLARENLGLAVLPPIVVTDELTSGLLVEVDRLPEIAETFYAVTVERRFPNPWVRTLLEKAAGGGDRPVPARAS